MLTVHAATRVRTSVLPQDENATERDLDCRARNGRYYVVALVEVQATASLCTGKDHLSNVAIIIMEYNTS